VGDQLGPDPRRVAGLAASLANSRDPRAASASAVFSQAVNLDTAVQLWKSLQ
jgi:hypothetical protein